MFVLDSEHGKNGGNALPKNLPFLTSGWIRFEWGRVG